MCAAQWGYPKRLRTDNGPEFLADKIGDWAKEHGIHWDFIQPGSPAQNACIVHEVGAKRHRFNRTFREDILDAYLFFTLKEARTITAGWMPIDNQERPHAALNGATPVQFVEGTQSGCTTNSHRRQV